jgi:molybdopterin molybdotransferase
MLTVDEALERVLRAAVPLAPARCALREALGCRLAETVTADRDSPPFDKSLVDGYAIRSADWPAESATGRFLLLEEVPAGRVPTTRVGPGQATLVMTGAPMPQGADTVVMREDAHADGDGVVLAPMSRPVRGGHWLERGRETRAGAIVALPGSRLDPVRLGVLATVGASRPLVWPRPRVAILTTGDELVPPEADPGPGQIRNSNTAMLDGLVRQARARVLVLDTAPDERPGLAERLECGLDPGRADVLVVSGGVSAGSLDLVPETLVRLGVEPIFHKVRLKPGKPLFFGIRRPIGHGTPPVLVFGLPGNPVSALVGFLLFVRPALERLANEEPLPAVERVGRLARPFVHRGDRPTYHPCRLEAGCDGSPWVDPLPWAGSPDLRTVADADAFAVFPAGERSYLDGETVGILAIPGRDWPADREETPPTS